MQSGIGDSGQDLSSGRLSHTTQSRSSGVVTEEHNTITSDNVSDNQTFLLNADGTPYSGAYYRSYQTDSTGHVVVTYQKLVYKEHEVGAGGVGDSSSTSLSKEQGGTLYLAQAGDNNSGVYDYNSVDQMNASESNLNKPISQQNYISSDNRFAEAPDSSASGSERWQDRLTGNPADWSSTAPSDFPGGQSAYDQYRVDKYRTYQIHQDRGGDPAPATGGDPAPTNEDTAPTQTDDGAQDKVGPVNDGARAARRPDDLTITENDEDLDLKVPTAQKEISTSGIVGSLITESDRDKYKSAKAIAGLFEMIMEQEGLQVDEAIGPSMFLAAYLAHIKLQVQN